MNILNLGAYVDFYPWTVIKVNVNRTQPFEMGSSLYITFDRQKEQRFLSQICFF